MGLQLYTTQLGLRWANDAGVRGSGTSEETCKAALAAASAPLLRVGGFQADERWLKKKKNSAPKNRILREICFYRQVSEYAYGSGGLVAPTEAVKSPLNGKPLHQNSDTGV